MLLQRLDVTLDSFVSLGRARQESSEVVQKVEEVRRKIVAEEGIRSVSCFEAANATVDSLTVRRNRRCARGERVDVVKAYRMREVPDRGGRIDYASVTQRKRPSTPESIPTEL